MTYYAPVGSNFEEREKCPAGIYRGYAHRFALIGKHKNNNFPDQDPRLIGMFIIEVDKRDSKGRRFMKIMRETFSAHPKSKLRTKYAPVLIPESALWSDDDWATKDMEALFSGHHLMLRINDRGWPEGIAALPPSKEPMVPELEWPDAAPEDGHPVITRERYGDSRTRVEDFRDTAARLMKPQVAKPGKVKVSADPEPDDGAEPDAAEWNDQF